MPLCSLLKIILIIWEIRGVQSSVGSISLLRGVLLELWIELGGKCPWFSRLPQHLVVFESKIDSCFKNCQNRHSSHPAGLFVAQSLFWTQRRNDEAAQNFRLVCTHWMDVFFLVSKIFFFNFLLDKFLKSIIDFVKASHKWRMKVSWFGVANLYYKQECFCFRVSHSSEAAVLGRLCPQLITWRWWFSH